MDTGINSHSVPKCCSALQSNIEELMWAREQLKLLPQLPKGKLREKILQSLHDIIENESPAKERVEVIINRMSKLESSINTCVDQGAKRLTPELASNIRDDVRSIMGEARSILHSLVRL